MCRPGFITVAGGLIATDAFNALPCRETLPQVHPLFVMS